MLFTPEYIRKRCKGQPFVPLRLVTSSGESYEVHHPDMLWVGERDVHVGISSKKNPSIYSQVSRVALMHITAIEDLAVPPSAQGNGQDAHA
jgi:hypothetical protein